MLNIVLIVINCNIKCKRLLESTKKEKKKRKAVNQEEFMEVETIIGDEGIKKIILLLHCFKIKVKINLFRQNA